MCPPYGINAWRGFLLRSRGAWRRNCLCVAGSGAFFCGGRDYGFGGLAPHRFDLPPLRGFIILPNPGVVTESGAYAPLLWSAAPPGLKPAFVARPVLKPAGEGDTSYRKAEGFIY